jgi:predicted ester cyclase
MATLDRAAIVRDIYECWNRRDFDRIVSYSHPDAKMTNVPFGTKLASREYTETWANAFPDGKVEVLNVVAQGDLVVAEFIGRGTHTGPLKGPAGELPPTGRRLEMPFVEIVRFRGEKIAEGRIYFDAATLFTQLGASLPAGAAQARGAAPTAQPRH